MLFFRSDSYPSDLTVDAVVLRFLPNASNANHCIIAVVSNAAHVTIWNGSEQWMFLRNPSTRFKATGKGTNQIHGDTVIVAETGKMMPV